MSKVIDSCELIEADGESAQCWQVVQVLHFVQTITMQIEGVNIGETRSSTQLKDERLGQLHQPG